MIGIERLADVFVGVADTLVAEFDVIEFLHSVAAHATEMTGAAAAGLMLSDLDGGLHYMGASNESARVLELFQIQHEEGPCLDCYRSGAPVTETDLTGSSRWPEFAQTCAGGRRGLRPCLPDAAARPGDRRPQRLRRGVATPGRRRVARGPGPRRPGDHRDPPGAQHPPGRDRDRAAAVRAEQQDRDRAGEGRRGPITRVSRSRRPSRGCARTPGSVASVSPTWLSPSWRLPRGPACCTATDSRAVRGRRPTSPGDRRPAGVLDSLRGGASTPPLTDTH